MKLTNEDLNFFVDKIKLKPENMDKYRRQINNLKEKLEKKIKEDDSHGLKVTKYILAGSWKKRTILRPTGDYPIDIDLVLFVGGDNNIQNDLKKLYDYIITYLEEIYPSKDIRKDYDAKGNTKSITIIFSGSGLEVDIVPVVPIESPIDYVWQPSKRGGAKYITSISKQLEFSLDKRKNNPSYTSIVRALKWWRNEKELKPTDDEPGLSSYVIELIVAYLDLNKGIETDIEEGLIRFFEFVSSSSFPDISFQNAINSIPSTYSSAIYVSDDTNNENNVAKRMTDSKWKEIVKEASDAFEILNIAYAKRNEGDTLTEWRSVFGSNFNIK